MHINTSIHYGSKNDANIAPSCHNMDIVSLPQCIPIIAAVTRKTNDESKFKKNYATTNLSNLYHEKLVTPTIFPPSNYITLKERNLLDNSITGIMQAGKMLRILFHPNQTFNTPLSERILKYSKIEVEENGQKKEEVEEIVKIYSDHAVLTSKGHLIYEISKNNLDWQNYLKSKNLTDMMVHLFKEEK